MDLEESWSDKTIREFGKDSAAVNNFIKDIIDAPALRNLYNSSRMFHGIDHTITKSIKVRFKKVNKKPHQLK